MRTTLDQRVAPFDWRELAHSTEYVHPPAHHDWWISEKMLDELQSKLELLFPNGDYDDSYDLPMWEVNRVSVRKVKHRKQFISKTKENK